MVDTNEFNSILDLLKAFPDEQTCINHLEKLRWNGNVVSPFDPSSRVYDCKDNKYKCKNTGKYFNVKTATLFDNTKVELQKWFLAIWLVTSHKKGISSLQLAKDIKVTQKTAWFMLQRIRNCFNLDKDGNEMLGGEGEVVSVDETFVGGKNKNRHRDKKVEMSQGRSFKDKTPVLGLIDSKKVEVVRRAHKIIPGKEVLEKVLIKPAEVRCIAIPDTKGQTIKPLIKKHIKQNTTLVSDEWKAYRGLSSHYDHQVVDHGSKEYQNSNGFTTNPIEGVWTLLKRAYIGIYHFMSRKHLQLYANEVAFRYNSIHLSEGRRFNLFLSNCERRLTYKALIN